MGPIVALAIPHGNYESHLSWTTRLDTEVFLG